MKYKFIEQKTWNAPFVLVIASDKIFTDWLNKIQKERKFDYDDEECDGGYYDFKKTIKAIDVRRIIWLKEFRNTAESIGILSHEILHYVIRTLHNKGITLDHNSEEAYTYLFDYTLTACLKALKK